jgi:cytochrome c oxidase assembly protein subunit 15
VHAWPGYALLALTLVLLVAAWRLKLPTLGWVGVLLAVEVVQIAVGLYQARNGLPPVAVGVHMVLAALTAATMTVLVLRLKRAVAASEPARDVPAAASAR